MKKYDYNTIKKEFEERGCILISKEFVAVTQPLEYICKCGQKQTLSYHKFRYQKKGCRNCSGLNKYTYEQVVEIFKKENCALISKEYIDNQSKLNYTCSCGNEGNTPLCRFLSGTRCNNCGLKNRVKARMKFDYEYVYNFFKNYNCELLSKEYSKAHDMLKYICSCGQENKKSFSSFKRNQRCPRCTVKKYIKSGRFYDYLSIEKELIKFSRENGRAPSKSDIMKMKLPYDGIINYYKKMETTYTDRLFEMGFGYNNYNLKKIKEEFELFYIKNHKYPKISELWKYEELPTPTVFRRVLKDEGITREKFYESLNYHKDFKKECDNNNNKIKAHKFKNEYDKLKEVVREYGIISSRDFKKYGLKSSAWFVDNYPNKPSSIKKIMSELGKNYWENKSDVVDYILARHSNGEIITYEYFKHNKDMGIKVIRNHFGTLNNMFKELGLPLNQENMRDRSKNITEMKRDILELAHIIKTKENRIIITSHDINNNNQCVNYGTYQNRFKKELNVTVRDFLEDEGYQFTRAGFGMNFEFEDGERVYSRGEYELSLILRKNGFVFNQDFQRDIKYKNFIANYEGDMNCDYCILLQNGECIYIEVAGMLEDHEKDYYQNNKIKYKRKESYRLKLKEKENMFKRNNLNYIILFPKEINDDIIHRIKTKNNNKKVG